MTQRMSMSQSKIAAITNKLDGSDSDDDEVINQPHVERQISRFESRKILAMASEQNMIED